MDNLFISYDLKNPDTLIGVDATNNDAAWLGLTTEVSEHIRQNWGRQTAGVSRY